MPALQKTQNCSSGSCCVPKRDENKKMDFPEFLIEALEKLSVVALGIFSCYTNWKLFVPFFGLGVGMGLYSHIKDKQSGKTGGVSSCSQGFIEAATGVKLPRIASLAGNVAVTVAHVKCHSNYFVWIVAMAIGAAVGKLMGYLYDKAKEPTALPVRRKVVPVQRHPTPIGLGSRGHPHRIGGAVTRHAHVH